MFMLLNLTFDKDRIFKFDESGEILIFAIRQIRATPNLCIFKEPMRY